MKCKRCKRELPEYSLYCNWCGAKQITDGNVNVPKPKRLASGEYVGRVMVDGNRERIKAATEAEYYRKARALKLELIGAKNIPANMKFDDLLQKYITDHEAVLSPSTVRGYETIRKQLKKYTDDKVKNIDMQELVSSLKADYAGKTVKNQWGLIESALKYMGLTVPVVKLPPSVKKERNFLEPEQIKVFVKAIRGRPWELAALLALHSLRVSEILALTGDSVKDGVIHVRGAVVRDKKHKQVRKEENKTFNSTRDIPVFIPRLTELWTDDPHIPDPSSLSDSIRRACRRNALPEVTTHGLRHSFCSLAYYQGWDLKTTQQVGGWSTAKVPMDVYTHLTNSRYKEDIKKMEDFYS